MLPRRTGSPVSSLPRAAQPGRAEPESALDCLVHGLYMGLRSLPGAPQEHVTASPILFPSFPFSVSVPLSVCLCPSLVFSLTPPLHLAPHTSLSRSLPLYFLPPHFSISRFSSHILVTLPSQASVSFRHSLRFSPSHPQPSSVFIFPRYVLPFPSGATQSWLSPHPRERWPHALCWCPRSCHVSHSIHLPLGPDNQVSALLPSPLESLLRPESRPVVLRKDAGSTAGHWEPRKSGPASALGWEPPPPSQ